MDRDIESLSMIYEQVVKQVADAQARGELDKALERVRESDYFFRRIINEMRIIEDTSGSTPTMSTDGKNLYYNPKYVRQLLGKYGLNESIQGIIVHEILHIAFSHHFIFKKELDEAKATNNKTLKFIINVACDLAINDLLKGRRGFPTDEVYIPSYNPNKEPYISFPPNKDARWYYNQLVDWFKNQKQQQDQQQQQQQPPPPQDQGEESEQQQDSGGGEGGDEGEQQDQGQEGGGEGQEDQSSDSEGQEGEGGGEGEQSGEAGDEEGEGDSEGEGSDGSQEGGESSEGGQDGEPSEGGEGGEGAEGQEGEEGQGTGKGKGKSKGGKPQPNGQQGDGSGEGEAGEDSETGKEGQDVGSGSNIPTPDELPQIPEEDIKRYEKTGEILPAPEVSEDELEKKLQQHEHDMKEIQADSEKQEELKKRRGVGSSGGAYAGVDYGKQLQEKAKVPWGQIINQFLTENERSNRSYRKPSSRYSFSDFVFPSYNEQKLNELIIIVDVSSSNHEAASKMFPELVAAINSSGFGQKSALRLISFNTKIEDEYVFSYNRKPYKSTMFAGQDVPEEKIITPDSESLVSPEDVGKFKWRVGGGTIIRPVFEGLKHLESKPPFIVVITDGEFDGRDTSMLKNGETEQNIIWIMSRNNGIQYPGLQTYNYWEMDYD